MKTKTSTNLFCAVALSASGLALAQTQIPNTFEAGQPARAAEVNENFSALKTGVDNNADALAINEVAIQNNLMAIAGLSSGEVKILDFSDPDACIIDLPGNYILDRSWQFSESETCLAEENEDGIFARILISANNVTLDLEGFVLSDDQASVTDVLISVAGSNVVVFNGTIRKGDRALGVGYQPELIATGSRVTAQFITANGVHLLGPESIVRHSNLVGVDGGYGHGVVLGPSGVLEHSYVKCLSGCVFTPESTGDTTIRFNRIFADDRHLILRGNRSLVEGNLFWGWPDYTVIEVLGDDNTFVRNTLLSGASSGSGHAITVNGTRNIIESNIAKTYDTGINFFQSGNYYGGNRISASFGDYVINDTNQTDWGGNVSF
jgi:hypothetical protein